ncbi:MAG: orotidine-5'-phosphate decarboxylase [Nitrospinae bacterium]|nr:orotidine-5'-phosphate decarboxylase [Nitrospinota bacterium]
MLPLKEPKDRIIFPLDFPEINSAMRYVEILKDHIGLFKVGLELFVREGPAILRVISNASRNGNKSHLPVQGQTGGREKIFLDLKFHDIPETVKRALRSADVYRVNFITIHCDEGKDMMESIAETASERIKVLAITLLTSLSREGLKEMGMREDLQDPLRLVLHRAKIAKSAGCAGVVCSGLEAEYVKKELGEDFIVVTPGIRPSWSIIHHDDQKRITTPFEAIKAGADYIVVGRPITASKDPADAARRIAEEIEKALDLKRKNV